MNDMMRSTNPNMPVGRRTLLEHIESGDLTYATRNGSTISIDRDEMDDLAVVCTEMEKMRLRLPIYVTADTGSDNTWRVDGKTEAAVVSKILKKPLYRDDAIRFYHPDLRELRRRFPNAVTVLYLP